MLHSQTHARNANPAAKAQRDGLAALFDQLDDIGIKTNGRHGHHNKELRQLLDGRRKGRGKLKHRGDHARQHKEQHEHGKRAFKRERAFGVAAVLARQMHLPACEDQRDGNNGQRPGELDHRGALEHIGAGMHAVPSARRSRYGRGVVDGGAGKQAKALVGQPEHAAEQDDQPADSVDPAILAEKDAAIAERDARIAELEKQLSEKETDASAIANALVTAQRSAQEVLDAARAEAKRIHNDAEIEASDIVDRANAEKAKIETAIEELDRSHKKTCEAYSEALKSFIDDANAKLDDIEDELAKKEGKKRSHGRFASPAQAPVHKPMFGATGAVAPSYVAPAAGAVESAPVTPAVTAAPATATVIPAQSAAPAPAPSVEKDLSGFGDAAEAFDLGDID